MTNKILELLLERGPLHTRTLSIVLNTDITIVNTMVKELLNKNYVISSTGAIFGDINQYTVICIRPSMYQSVLKQINS
jgi:predicted transcriptional regulator